MATVSNERRDRDEPARSGPPVTSLADRFRAIADGVTNVLGTPWALLAAVLLIVGWAMTGPIFGFSDTWQLVINTATTIITFLMVFVIQTSQNRQAKATQFKLDELIHVIPEARNQLIRAELQSREEEERIEREFLRAAQEPSAGEDDQPPGQRGEGGTSSDAA
jgi:low affinity Fe/Cu permease